MNKQPSSDPICYIYKNITHLLLISSNLDPKGDFGIGLNDSDQNLPTLIDLGNYLSLKSTDIPTTISNTPYPVNATPQISSKLIFFEERHPLLQIHNLIVKTIIDQFFIHLASQGETNTI